MKRLFALLLLWSVPARATDHVTFGLDWLAEAEYGGYYQAKAIGAYARHGLEVEIRQGGPQVNQAQLLLGGPAGFLDFRQFIPCVELRPAGPAIPCRRRDVPEGIPRSSWRIPASATTVSRRCAASRS
ncbi:MAG: hypothetical protein WDN04_19720 [Rhodospirillales bacterium]